MTGLLMAALERLPPRLRRLAVAAGALVLIGAVLLALTLTSSRERGTRRRQTTVRPPAATESPRQGSPRRVPPPVSTAAMLEAHRVAERFLSGYLPFAYARASAHAVGDVTAALRSQLLRTGLS